MLPPRFQQQFGNASTTARAPGFQQQGQGQNSYMQASQRLQEMLQQRRQEQGQAAGQSAYQAGQQANYAGPMTRGGVSSMAGAAASPAEQQAMYAQRSPGIYGAGQQMTGGLAGAGGSAGRIPMMNQGQGLPWMIGGGGMGGRFY